MGFSILPQPLCYLFGHMNLDLHSESYVLKIVTDAGFSTSILSIVKKCSVPIDIRDVPLLSKSLLNIDSYILNREVGSS